MNKYSNWIENNIHENCRGLCYGSSKKMTEQFPELKMVRGWCNYSPHWWCKTSDNEIVDPTASQFLIPREYVEFIEGVDKEPVGKCMNCGEYVWTKEFGTNACCKECLEGLKEYYKCH